MTDSERVDVMGVKIEIDAARPLLSPKQLTHCLSVADFDAEILDKTTGMGQYTLPTSQLVQFHQAIAAKCGEAVLRLFYSNLGMAAALSSEKLPITIAIRDRNTGGDKYTQLTNLIRGFVGSAQGAGWNYDGPRPVPDAVNRWHIGYSTCLYCIGLHTHKPICAAIPAFWRQKLMWAANLPITVEEIRCRATGDSECVIEVVLLQ